MYQQGMELSQTSSFDTASYMKRKIDGLNETRGNLTGYDCPICLNRGFIAYSNGMEIMNRRCECMKARKSLKLIKKSGLDHMLRECTFQRYKVNEAWQGAVLRSAKEYLNSPDGSWFMMAGSSGAGKTHICTAVCGELLNRCHEVRYMLWLDDSQKLKAAKTDEKYESLIKPFKEAEVLYIDDFFKMKRGSEIKDTDVRLAYEILNYRYTDPKKRTILSSEWTLEQIIDADQALGGRIREKTRGYYVLLTGNKDWRLR